MSLRAGLTGLIAIWIALALSLPSPPAKGLRVDLAVSSGSMVCDQDRLVFAFVLPDGRLRLNEDEVEGDKLDSRLEEIFRNSPDRVLFVIPDPASTVGQVTAFIDIAKNRVRHVALLSHKVLQNQGNCGPTIHVPPPALWPTPVLKPVPLWHGKAYSFENRNTSGFATSR